MKCAYCEQPLVCDACGAAFEPADAAQYEAVGSGEEAVSCPTCEALLVCHWCKTPYDGRPLLDDTTGES
jgi:hypothetical protein